MSEMSARVVPLQSVESVGEMPSHGEPLQHPALLRRGVYAPTAIVEDVVQPSIANAMPDPVFLRPASSSLPNRLKRASSAGAASFRSVVQGIKPPARTTSRKRPPEAEDVPVLRRGQFSLRSFPTLNPMPLCP
jgi:hypothetical protein